MKIKQQAVLKYCRDRSCAIYDFKSGAFLGTATAIGPNYLMSCNHCVNGRNQVSDGTSLFSIVCQMPCLDTVLLESLVPLNMTHFIASSEDAQMGETVVVYGYRHRDGHVNDVAILTNIGSFSERILANDCDAHQVYGFGKRNLIEHGMSGGVVLRTTTFEMIGYIIGYDHPQSEERKDDVFVTLSTALFKNPNLSKHFTFGHQRRAIRINLARRLLSLSGFTVKVERLGSELGLDECLVCKRGKGVLQNTILLVTATSEQMSDITHLNNLYKLSQERAPSHNINFDTIYVLVDEGFFSNSDLHSIITVEDLIHSAPVSSTDYITDAKIKSTGLITGQFLQRFLMDVAYEKPAPAIEAIKNAIESRIKLIIINGIVGSGKSTVISNFQQVAEGRLFSGDSQSPATYNIDLSTEFIDKIPKGKKSDTGPLVVSLLGFDKLWASGDTAQTLRKIKLIISELDNGYYNWSILLSISGGLEQTKRILGPVLNEIDKKGTYKILELLPLSPNEVKKALFIELGASEGNAWWKTVASSQEIFQIAQWPTGLSILLDRVVQSSWTHHQANQVEVIAAIVNGFLGRSSANPDGLPPPATINFLISLAEEINATQNMQVAIERARKIYAAVVPQAHSIHSIAATDVIVPGLVSQSDSPDSVGFESPIFLHYLLSLAILKSIESCMLGSTNPLFHRRMPVALLKDVVQLGVDTKQLIDLIQSSIGKHENEVGYIGGNCVSLLRLLNYNFKEIKMENCDLRGGIFTECDLENANFCGAKLIDVGLANSNIMNVNFSNANLTRADLKSGCTVYQLATYCDSVYAATSSRYLVRIDLDTDESIKISDISGFSDAVFAVSISAEDNLLIAGGQDGTIRGWDLEATEPKFILRGHFSDIRSLAISENRIVSGSVDGHVNIWSPWSASLINSYNICRGEIWSLELLNNNTAAILCDQNHVHIFNILDGTVYQKYDLPDDHTRRLIIDHKTNRLFVGGHKFIWILDYNNKIDNLLKVSHPFVRTVFRTYNNEFLIGGAFGKVQWIDENFTTFNDISLHCKDYIADFTEFTNNTVLGSGAGGRLFMLERDSQSWVQKHDFGLLDSSFRMKAKGSDFRTARNLPDERKKILADYGALV